MKYIELFERLKSATPAQLQQDATLYVECVDEYIPIKGLATAAVSQDVVDPGHLLLEID